MNTKQPQSISPGSQEVSPSDLAFPTLTEVMSVPRYPAEDLPESIAAINWTSLETRVRENVMERLVRRSELMLDERLKATLEPIAQRAVESFSAELQTEISQIVRDVVARAVNEELTRLQTEIHRRHNHATP
jgi:hypothetical protein